MVLVAYQIIFTEDKDAKKELIELLKNAFADNYDEFSEEEIDNIIEIKYTKRIDEYKQLIGFDIDINEIGNEIDSVISDFNDSLRESPNISLITKFYDENLFSNLSKIYEKIFSIEMRLREAITLIFLDTYKTDYYNLLKDSSINPCSGKDGLPRDDKQKRDFLEKLLENEFFHISFKDYPNLYNIKELKQEDLFPITEASKDFQEFKEKILNRGVTNKYYKNFLEEIKRMMDNLEKIRNCVAHNRNLKEGLDYEKYFEEIGSKLDNFFIQIFEADYQGPFTDLWEDGGGEDFANSMQRFYFKKEVLNFYIKNEEFSIDKHITCYLHDNKGILGLKFYEEEDKLSAHLIDLRNLPKEHQERWHKYLINNI
jgi:hypothetical protein